MKNEPTILTFGNIGCLKIGTVIVTDNRHKLAQLLRRLADELDVHTVGSQEKKGNEN